MSLLKSESYYQLNRTLQHSKEIAEGVYQIELSIVNAYIIRSLVTSGSWILVDCGLFTSAKKILQAARELFGPHAQPEAIVLTHGHFDHVGALEQLLEEWEVPVFAHPLEMPYLDGVSEYPPPDPAVGGGGMALLSRLYPRGPIDVSRSLVDLPRGGAVPYMPEWEWLFTPGHTPGHVSLYREADGVLIAGDAFVTTRQESVFCALFKPEEVNGPPKYYTTDWEAAWDSVVLLNKLPITVAATGHGQPMYAPELTEQLDDLADNFEEVAIPATGRYVEEPAEADEHGVMYVPPRVVNGNHLVAGMVAVAVAGALLGFKSKS